MALVGTMEQSTKMAQPRTETLNTYLAVPSDETS